jgi:hypothetical protein
MNGVMESNRDGRRGESGQWFYVKRDTNQASASGRILPKSAGVNEDQL